MNKYLQPNACRLAKTSRSSDDGFEGLQYFDPLYEFDAPKWIDLGKVGSEEDYAQDDAWFEQLHPLHDPEFLQYTDALPPTEEVKTNKSGQANGKGNAAKTSKIILNRHQVSTEKKSDVEAGFNYNPSQTFNSPLKTLPARAPSACRKRVSPLSSESSTGSLGSPQHGMPSKVIRSDCLPQHSSSLSPSTTSTMTSPLLRKALSKGRRRRLPSVPPKRIRQDLDESVSPSSKENEQQNAKLPTTEEDVSHLSSGQDDDQGTTTAVRMSPKEDDHGTTRNLKPSKSNQNSLPKKNVAPGGSLAGRQAATKQAKQIGKCRKSVKSSVESSPGEESDKELMDKIREHNKHIMESRFIKQTVNSRVKPSKPDEEMKSTVTSKRRSVCTVTKPEKKKTASVSSFDKSVTNSSASNPLDNTEEKLKELLEQHNRNIMSKRFNYDANGRRIITAKPNITPAPTQDKTKASTLSRKDSTKQKRRSCMSATSTDNSTSFMLDKTQDSKKPSHGSSKPSDKKPLSSSKTSTNSRSTTSLRKSNSFKIPDEKARKHQRRSCVPFTSSSVKERKETDSDTEKEIREMIRKHNSDLESNKKKARAVPKPNQR